MVKKYTSHLSKCYSLSLIIHGHRFGCRLIVIHVMPKPGIVTIDDDAWSGI
jgi:hypothetical protein